MAAGDREVIVLRYLEQLSVCEIAAVLGVSEGAVKSRHMRALLRLRAEARWSSFGEFVMIDSGRRSTATSTTDPLLSDLFEELAARIQAGESLDPEELAREYPNWPIPEKPPPCH